VGGRQPPEVGPGVDLMKQVSPIIYG
jgi:hypothetical protein